jgi:iron complex outermembrane receptor protein
LWAESPQEAKIAVSGVVSDADGPVIGASVVEKGTSNGTATDVDGNYSLRVSPNATLEISYLGYATQSVAVNGKTVLNVILQEDATALGEVVVTALGIKRDTRALGYAISTVKGDDLIKAGVTANPLQALYGKSAGVGIQSTSSGPMGGMNIKIRGAASMNVDQKVRPLFVIDGVPIADQESGMASRNYDPLNSFDYGAGINDINPDDIASMEILKGAKASVLYGDKGANGVVLITTKSGNAGRKGLGIDVSFNHEWEKPVSYINFQNEYGTGTNEYTLKTVDGVRQTISDRYNFGPKFDGSPIQFFDGSMRTYNAYDNNYMDLFQNGSSNNVSVALSSAGEKGSARFAYTHYDYEGTMAHQEHTKNSLSFNGSFKASDKLTFDFTENLYITETQNRRQNIARVIAYGGFNRDYDLKTAMTNYKDKNGYMYTAEEYTNQGWPAAFSEENRFFDMLWNNNENVNLDAKHHSITSVKMNLQFLPYMSLKLQAGLDYNATAYTKKDKVKRFNESNNEWVGGKFQYANETSLIQNYDAMITFDKDQIYKEWNLFAFIGGAYRKDSYDKVGVGTLGHFLYPDYWSLKNISEWGTSYDDRIANYRKEGDETYSVYGQATLSWERTHYLEFSARNDWASTLPSVNRSYFYPGVSYTYNFTEDFTIPKVNYGKFRVSWADVGRPAPRYYALRNYTVDPLPAPNLGVNDVTGPSDLLAGDLKSERKREFEVGFNLKAFDKDRVEVDFAFYNNTVYDQIMGVNLAPSTGNEKMRINAGNVRNNGVEVLLKVAPVVAQNYRWDWTFTFARQWNKVVKLYPGIPSNNRTVSGVVVKDKEGEPMGQMYMKDYRRDEKGNRIVSPTGFYDVSGKEIAVGNIYPDIFGGINTNFGISGNWGAADVSIGFDYRLGGEMLSYTNYYLKGNGLSKETLKYRDTAHGGLTYTDADGRERHDGLILPGVKADGSANDKIISAYDYYRSFNHDMSEGWQPDEIKTNNYLKVREFSVNYTFPVRITNQLKVQRLSIGVTARNLFYIYKSIDNIDPEGVLGTGPNDSWIENSGYPTSRTFGLNIKLGF